VILFLLMAAVFVLSPIYFWLTDAPVRRATRRAEARDLQRRREHEEWRRASTERERAREEERERRRAEEKLEQRERSRRDVQAARERGRMDKFDQFQKARAEIGLEPLSYEDFKERWPVQEVSDDDLQRLSDYHNDLARLSKGKAAEW
jgi:hypothetical protein